MREDVSNVGGILYRRIVYDHGGSRIWFEPEQGKRKLLADTYEPESVSNIIWEAILADAKGKK